MYLSNSNFNNQVSSLISNKEESFLLNFKQPPATSTAEEIAALRKEIEELRKQPPQIIYKTILKPVSSSPMTDLKTQEEMNNAKEQISSLEQRLKQLQQVSPSSAASEAELIKSWQVNKKVTQIACLNKFTNSWQLGSGVLISGDGKVLTNQHVVRPSVGVLLPDYCLVLFENDYDAQLKGYKKQYRAGLVGFFEDRDAALLKIQDIVYRDQNGAAQLMPLSGSFNYFESTSAFPQIGETVYVVGFPESASYAFSVTKGIISNYTTNNIYFGTDAQIDRGNSGGAAINSGGQLIGLPTYKYVGDGDYRGYILNINSLKL